MRFWMLLLDGAFLVPHRLEAQYKLTPLLAKFGTDTGSPSPPFGESHCNSARAITVLAGGVGGAAIGWLTYTVGLGALASDHGAVYKSERRNWVAAGSVVGVTYGVVRILRNDCHELLQSRSFKDALKLTDTSWLLIAVRGSYYWGAPTNRCDYVQRHESKCDS